MLVEDDGCDTATPQLRVRGEVVLGVIAHGVNATGGVRVPVESVSGYGKKCGDTS